MRKRCSRVFSGLASIVLTLAMLVASTVTSELPVVVVVAPNADLHLEVATTPEQQERGLMGRSTLAPNAGMLFVFENDGPEEFWMKNTLIPLDMIFVAADGVVRKVYAKVATVPPSLPDAAIPREAGKAKYVIELGGGGAARAGIAAGVRLHIVSVAP
jgi:uncharacterized membrane protein (UPF0127 family)